MPTTQNVTAQSDNQDTVSLISATGNGTASTRGFGEGTISASTGGAVSIIGPDGITTVSGIGVTQATDGNDGSIIVEPITPDGTGQTDFETDGQSGTMVLVRLEGYDVRLVVTPTDDDLVPPVDEEDPPVDDGEDEEPPVDGEEPPTDGEEPPTDGEEPPTDGEQPPTDGEEPPTDGEEPPTDGEEPPTDGEEPPTDGEEPPTEEPSPPAAVDDAFSTVAGQPAAISIRELLSNDADNAEVVLFSNFTGGNLSHLVFVPDTGFTGEASLSFSYRDADGNTQTDSATIQVNGADGTGQETDGTDSNGTDDASSVAETGQWPVVISVADLLPVDDNGNQAELTGVWGVEGGELSHVFFMPETDFTGEASFNYTIQTTEGDTESATVTIDVSEATGGEQPPTDGEEPPVDGEEPPTDGEQPPTDGEEPPTDDSPDFDTVAGTPVAVAIQDLLPTGSEGAQSLEFSNFENGSISHVVFVPSPGFTGEASFSFTYLDADGNEQSGTATIQVDEAPAQNGNSGDSAEVTSVAAGSEDPSSPNGTTQTSVPVALSLADLLPEGENIEDVQLTGISDVEGGSVSHVLFAPTDGFTGEASFDYAIQSLNGESSSGTATVNVTEAPTNGEEPPTDGEEPPTDGEQPPTDGEEPPTNGEQPPTDGEEPPTNGEQPPTDGEEPPTDGEQPPTDGEEPPTNGEQPPTNGEQPPTNGEPPVIDEPPAIDEPPTDGEEPPTNGEQPPTDGEEPPTNGEQPPTDGEEPPTNGEQPPTDGEEPPTDGEQPPTDGEEPPTNGEQPPT
ncbi:hypothetical protein, partial [Telmatospirillum sp. J64-1]|uniref:Ig-like domain-containing protein n=1 Tax=Telmatospirillum sp. J64-1 TaxID=2502183 RepID=UPI00351BADA0